MNSEFNRTMLQLARLRLGLSQTELSERSGIPQSVISKAELGSLIPKADQIKKLADALDVKKSFFAIQSPAYASMTPVFRKRSTMSQKDINRAESIGSITVAQMNNILRASGLDGMNICDIPFLDPDGYEEGGIAVARAARQFFGLPKGAIDNITSLMEDHGVMIFFRNDFPGKIDGYTIYPESFAFPYTFVNSACQGERVRMTLAHELGHIFMHKYETPKCEIEAWDFAGEFLMPEDQFLSDLPRRLTNLNALLPLKFKWKVSLGAIAQRLKNLEVISDRTFRYLRIQLSKYGKTEPYPITMENPELYHDVFNYCQEKLDYSLKELKEYTGFNDEEFSIYYINQPKQSTFRLGL